MNPELIGLIGGIVGGIIGVAGGLLGTYFSIKNTNGPQERAFVIKASIACWIFVLAFVFGMCLIPGLYKLFLIPIYVVGLVAGILLGNKKQAQIRLEESKKNPAVPYTQIIPRNCPQCGAELKPEVSEGLCPACLLQRGIATEGGAPPGTPPFTPPTIPNLAKLFPQLEILELIGKGGMGAVYKARQPALDRFVALKILAPRSGGDLDFAERFTREARALAKLSHPNIVAVYDFGQAGALSYFIMEHVDGPNLRQIEQAGRLSPREALEIIPQICGALQFAHDEGIVHRDIKPENVLLDKKGRVKIADFGLAKILGQEPKDFRLTGARDVVGTPHYMAPEQIEKPSEVDHRADIYSLGVVFYEMLTGELPLGKFQPPSSRARGMQIDVRLDEVVLHALEKEPERRYQQASQVKTAVETIAATGSAGVAPDLLSRKSAAEPSGSASRNWLGMERAPFYSPEMREIASHLTKKERNQLRLIGGTTGALYAAIMAAVVWGIHTLGFTPTLWNVMGIVGLVLIVWSPIQVRVMRKFYCSTVWGKQRSYKPEQFKMFSFRGSNFWKKISALLFFMAVILCLVKGFNDFFLGAFFKVLPLLPPFQHYIGQAYFPKGDSIEIDTVARFKNWMIVKGHYTLVSHNNATLALYITSTNKNVPEDARQRMQISNGHGYFELADSHAVPGLPHISMYADGESFAALYFGTKAEALEERAAKWISTPPASTETWSPTLAPGEKPDLQKILDEAKTFMEQHKYEESLQRHLWHFNHAAEFGDSYQSVVRLTSGLSDWEELGRRYPKAKQALMEIRDSRTQQLAAGQGYSEMLHEVQAINHELLDDDATVALIKTIHAKDPKLTGQNYFWMEDLLLQKGEYDLLLDCMGDPQAHFESARRGFEMQIQSQQRMEEMRKQHPVPAPRLPGSAFTPPDMGQLATNNFIGEVHKLIEILVGADRKTDAEKIRDQAVAILDDARLKSAVSDAEENIQKRAASVSQPQTQDAVSAAQKWLALIDGGNYSETWNEASAIFRGAVTEPGWENSMNTFRQPLGDLISRKLKSAQLMTELPGAPDGRYVVMQFETSFANKKTTIETVTFMLEKDGQWKSAGYFIK